MGVLAFAWRGWRSASLVVRPDSVVRWHRQWLRRQLSAINSQSTRTFDITPEGKQITFDRFEG